MREDPARDDYAPGPVYRIQKSTCSGWGRGVIRLRRSNSITWSGASANGGQEWSMPPFGSSVFTKFSRELVIWSRSA